MTTTPEDHIHLATFLLENGHEHAAKLVLEHLAVAEKEDKEDKEDDDDDEKEAKEAAPKKSYFYLDPQIGVRLHEWHYGQGDPIYAVGSQIYAGKKVPRRGLQEAIDSLESIWDAEKQHKHMKPQDRNTLAELIDELNGYMSGNLEDESYAFEGD